MKPHLRSFLCLAVLAMAALPLHATVTFLNGYAGTGAEASSANELAYQADVSNAGLLHGVVPSSFTTGVGAGKWNVNNGATVPELNDGIHGVTYATAGNSVQGAWPNAGATATYTLGPGANNQGYNITSIQSMAAWVNAGFGNQAWTLAVQPAGGGAFVDVATVNCQPLGASSIGATKVTLSNLNITGIQALKVTTLSVNGGANNGAFVWRELEVFGTSAPPAIDTTPPVISTLSPANDSSNVLPSSLIVATFNENIALGTGTITLRDLDAPAETVITLPDPRVSVSGAVLTINPASDLAASTHHAIRISATAITDLSGNPFAGITNDTAWSFTTGLPDLTAPAILSLGPPDGATGVPLASNLVATYNENIALGTGTITLKDLNSPAQTVITLPDARVSVAGAVLMIHPASNLNITTDYAVQISSGAVTDLSGNPFAGIHNDTTWNFTTAAAPLRIMCLGDSITTGYTDNPTWTNHQFEFGYRSGLYTLLTDAGYNFLFVGASPEPWNNINGDPTHGGTYTPPLDLRTLGQDGHRGYGGASASTLQGNIVNWLNTDNPDLILLKIGTNSQNTGTLDTLVNTIVTTKPNARLIVAQIIPKFTYQAGIVTYNNYIANTLVPNYQAQGKKVTLVNQYPSFLTNPADLTSIDQSLYANGINHPTNNGYDKMARVWFDGIKALGLGPSTFDGWISDPAFGIAPGQRSPDQDPDGDGIENGVENYFGTNPGTFSQGMVAGTASGNTFTFTHPLNTSPANDLTAIYRWSKDLEHFTEDGGTFAGTTVSFSRGTPAGGFVTVTATVNGTPLERLFIDVKVRQN